MSTVKSFTVHRPTWLRGQDPDNLTSALYTYGKRCCLGFLGAACGYSDTDLDEVPGPSDTVADIEKNLWPEVLLKPNEKWSEENDDWTSAVVDSKLCKDMMNVNDDKNISDAEREVKLTTLFRRARITVTFTDETEPQKP